MPNSLQRPPETAEADGFTEALTLFERGLCLQAWIAAETLGPITSWTGAENCIFASRLAANLGAPRLATALHGRAYRADRSHPVAIYFRAASLFSHRGPLRAWRFVPV